MKRLPFGLETLLKPTSLIYETVTTARNNAYDRGIFKIHETKARVVLSVGNITAGGTGKTPVTAYLIRTLARTGVRVGIVSRGYGREGTKCERVPSQRSAKVARVYGDEPSWMASEFPNVPVYVCGDRVQAVQQLMSENEVQVVIADDAFQHRRLKRDLDIVVLDATEPRWHYQPLPIGRLREIFAGVLRADVVFITKTNLAEEGQVVWLRKQISEAIELARMTTGKNRQPLPIFEFEMQIEGFTPLSEPSAKPVALSNKRVLLISGIGRPHTFEMLVKASVPNCEIVEHMIYRDHHPYSADDLKSIERRAIALGAEAIVTTEKDATKVLEWQPERPCWVSRLVAAPRSDMKEFYEAIDRLVL